MKTRIAALIAACALLPVAACGTGSNEGSSGATTIRVADNWAPTHPMASAIDNIFKKQVEELSDGDIQVEVSHSGTLGDEADLWDAVRNGTLDIVVVGTPMNEEFPMMLISDWPFLYRDIEHARDVWTGDVAKEVSDAFHEKFPSTYILGWGPNSARTFSSNKKLESPEDFAGQKFRMPSNPIHISIAEDLGASAQVIPLGDLFTALETGVVDGQDNGMVTIVSEAFYEVQKYVYETNHIIATLEIIVSAPTLEGLSDKNQQIIREAAEEASTAAWNDYIDSIGSDRVFLEENGLTVTQVTDADRDILIDKLQPLKEQLFEQNGWAEDLVAKIENVR